MAAGLLMASFSTEVDAALNRDGKTELLSVKALNEWNSQRTSTTDWFVLDATFCHAAKTRLRHATQLTSSLYRRSKLDSQRGAILGHELKNNAVKVARWAAQSLLSGADGLKIGFV